MEPKNQSKKRKQQPPSNPFVGVFSRSKSQIYVHQNRSGRARSDTVPKQRHHLNLICPAPSRKRRAIREPEASNPQILSRTPVKDLRARRVFSPGASIDDDCSPEGGKSKTDCDVKDGGYCSPMNSEAEKSIDEGVLVIDLSPGSKEIVESGCRTKDSDVASPNLPVTEGEARGSTVIQKNHDDKIDSPMAEDGQKKVSVSIAPKLDETFNGNVHGINNHKIEWVVNSCTRRKVFKSPGSFSYRRMLPFLKDISADHSGVSNTEKPGLGYSGDDKDTKYLLQNSVGMSNGIDEMGEGDVQTTPPDRDIFSNPEVKDRRRSGNGTGLQIHDHVSRPPSNESIRRNNSFMPEGYFRPASVKTGYSPKSKLVLNPCSRIKKLKTVTSSFSYRRLLPYLMDNSRNQAYDFSSDTSKCAQPSEDASENKRPGPALGSKFENIPNGTSKTDYSPKLVHSADTELKPTASTLTCETDIFTNESMLASGENIVKLVCSQKDCTSPVEQCMSNKPNEVQPVLNDVSSNLDKSPPAMPFSVEALIGHDDLVPTTSEEDGTLADEKLSKDVKTIEAVNFDVKTSQFDNNVESEMSNVEDVIQNIYRSLEPEVDSSSSNFEQASQTMTLAMPADTGILLKEGPPENHDISLVSQEENYSKKAKSSEVVSSDENSSPIGDLTPSGNAVGGLAKGILRRNPRGCRGLCNCLSCASFRLHADKAFEFSRNQMLDAEEVAVELIKEMSHLRDMLEKYSADVNGQASLCMSQVKDACIKASKAEELAKLRLSEMNCDLAIHCRTMQLQRPRVRFANDVQETIIPNVVEKNKEKAHEGMQ